MPDGRKDNAQSNRILLEHRIIITIDRLVLEGNITIMPLGINRNILDFCQKYFRPRRAVGSFSCPRPRRVDQEKRTTKSLHKVLPRNRLKVYFRSFSLDILVSQRGIKAFLVHPEERLLEIRLK